MRIPSNARAAARLLAPWIAAALFLQLGLRAVWPIQTASARRSLAIASQLRGEVPDPKVLRRRIDSLAADSASLSAHIDLACRREMAGADPAAALAARLVPLLGEGGWKLQRVRADTKDGWAILDLGAEAPFEQVLVGLREIRSSSTALRIRRFSLRPAAAGRLGIDLQVASPSMALR